MLHLLKEPQNTTNNLVYGNKKTNIYIKIAKLVKRAKDLSTPKHTPENTPIPTPNIVLKPIPTHTPASTCVLTSTPTLTLEPT